MDAGLLWTAGGTLTGSAALVVGFWQLRLQAKDLRLRRSDGLAGGRVEPALVTAAIAPIHELPALIRGRDVQLAELVRTVHTSGGRVVVLTGTGGMGKSTLAAALAERMRLELAHRVWWISAADAGSLVSGMASLAKHLGASLAEQEVVASGSPQSPDALWTILDRQRGIWLLIIDNADAPEVLAAGLAEDRAGASIVDGKGWLRVPEQGMVLVTTRHRGASVWGRDVSVSEVGRLDTDSAGQVLLDLAPGSGDPADAEALGERLGGLPLALHLAGSYLGSEFASIREFTAFHAALDDSPRTVDLLAPDPDVRTTARMNIMRTWELSLDALDGHGVTQSRTLLRLLSCLAPLIPVPEGVLTIDALTALIPQDINDRIARTMWLEQGMRCLVRVGLVSRSVPGSPNAAGTLSLHPVIADVGRAQLETAREAGEPEARRIPDTAARMIADALIASKPEQSEDWPRFLGLAPHLRTLFSTAAPVASEETRSRLCDAAANLAYYFEWIGPPELATEICRLALSACGLPPNERAVLSLRYWYGRSLSLQGRWDEAEQTLTAVRAEQSAGSGDEAAETLRTRREAARVAAELGRYAEAEAALREVMAAQERVLGRDHPDTLNTFHTLGWVLAREECWSKAAPMFRIAAEGRARVFGEEHPYTLASRNRLAWTLGELGQLGEAESQFRRILSVRRQIFGDEHYVTLATRQRLAWVLALQGRLSEAEAELSDVVGTQTRLHGIGYPSTIDSSILLGRVIAQRGRPEEARALLESALERQSRLQGANHPQARKTRKLVETLSARR